MQHAGHDPGRGFALPKAHRAVESTQVPSVQRRTGRRDDLALHRVGGIALGQLSARRTADDGDGVHQVIGQFGDVEFSARSLP